MKKILIVAVGVTMMACTHSFDSNAEEVTTKRFAGQYTGIDAGQGIKVNVVADNTDSLIVTAPEDIIDKIITEVKGDMLMIHWDKKANIKSTRRVEVTVPMRNVNQIKASSGATVITDTIKGNNLIFRSSSGAQINTMVEALSVDAKSSSGASLRIIGKTGNAEYEASSGAHIAADSLLAADVVAEASSGSGIKLNAATGLKAKASSGGHIKYLGSPTMVNIASSSGGSISKK